MSEALQPDRCGTCRFWRDADADETGTCHRHAPRPFMLLRADDEDTYEEYPVWPLTLCDEFCGEWAPLPVRQTPAAE